MPTAVLLARRTPTTSGMRQHRAGLWAKWRELVSEESQQPSDRRNVTVTSRRSIGPSELLIVPSFTRGSLSPEAVCHQRQSSPEAVTRGTCHQRHGGRIAICVPTAIRIWVWTVSNGVRDCAANRLPRVLSAANQSRFVYGESSSRTSTNRRQRFRYKVPTLAEKNPLATLIQSFAAAVLHHLLQ